MGSQSYDQAELLAILDTRIRAGGEADASLIVAHQLIAARLNLANGSNPAPVSSTIDDADAVLGNFPYSVERSSQTGHEMF